MMMPPAAATMRFATRHRGRRATARSGDAPLSTSPNLASPSPHHRRYGSFDGLTEAMYSKLQLRIYKALITPFDPTDARKCDRGGRRRDGRGGSCSVVTS